MASFSLQEFHEDCDVVIVGGGMSGLTSAIALTHADPNLQVTILEESNKLCCGVDALATQWIQPGCHKEINQFLETHCVALTDEGATKNYGIVKTNKLSSSWSGFELTRLIREIDVICADYDPKTYVYPHAWWQLQAA